ncbi:type 1 glutamine amidotransferase [Erythrobacter sp. AP23]|uniref:type 1 glutamine amidotransferase n=1 Tax=Erythrobacter sp. AP23 TaxID=499656 RepID=UPI00076C67F1|nr:type 1 glutamine amidotransferase [Erythrobacter sp. AP23]KWV94040.1 hypothetical protein ASS64_09275 [Erythrobacter sp. AP23]
MTQRTAVFQHFSFPCLGHLGTFLDESGQPYETRVYSDINASNWGDFDTVDRLILLGSPASVNDDDDWINWMRKLVEEHLMKGKPTFGICFGSQLIASVLGAEIARLDKPRIGIRPLHFPNDPLSSGDWFCFHEDHILPFEEIGAAHVEGETVYQFEYGKTIGVQFHPEFDETTVRTIANAIGEENPYYSRLMEALEEIPASGRDRAFSLFSRVFDHMAK